MLKCSQATFYLRCLSQHWRWPVRGVKWHTSYRTKGTTISVQCVQSVTCTCGKCVILGGGGVGGTVFVWSNVQWTHKQAHRVIDKSTWSAVAAIDTIAHETVDQSNSNCSSIIINTSHTSPLYEGQLKDDTF